jgi:DNA invertase Pin-like site-specific DNA recombinase
MDKENAVLVPAALYARKSADEKLSPSSDTKTQVREIREWAPAHGFEIVEEFVDDGVKGWTLDRPEICAIQAAIRERPRKFNAIIISAWDRLSREIGDAFLITDELEAYGIRIVSVRQGEAVDDNSKLGRELQFIIAKHENASRGGHILAGQKRWASEGYSVGGAVLYGYRRQHVQDAKGVLRVKYEVDPAAAKVVRDVYTWYAEGENARKIAERLNALGIPTPRDKKWNEQAIYRLLFRRSHQEKYCGAMTFNRSKNSKRYKRSTPKPNTEWVICENAHPAILDDALVNAVKSVRMKQMKK